MKKILLLNLPYKNKKIQRDLSCPHTSKANYYWPPIDLIVYSAILSDQELYFIDCVEGKIDEMNLLKKIKKINPDYIFTIISSITFKEDLEIIRNIKKLNDNLKISVSGDLCSFEPIKVSKNKEIDFVINDFTEKESIRKIISNKQKNKIIYSSKNNNFKIGLPRHELFNKHKYKMPYSIYTPITTMITNYGCPFKCKFCNSNNLKFKSRDINEVIEEMKYIENRGIREVYFRDLTFGIPNLKELLDKIVQEKIKIKWSCEFRVDLANEEILKKMKEAGCYLIFYGIESGNQKTLDMMKKGFNLNQVKEAIKLTKKEKIETLTSFIIGFESEDEKDILNTKNFIKEINPDYISINVLVPRIGSTLRKENRHTEKSKLDSSVETGKIYSNDKSALDLKKDIEKSFYFKPKKLLRYFVLAMGSWNRFKNFLESGFFILLRTI